MRDISSNNKLTNLPVKIAGVIALTMSLFHLYCGYFGQPEAIIFRSTFLTFVLVLCFLLNPLGGKFWKGKFDLLLIINLLFVSLPILFQIYVLKDIEVWYTSYGNPTNLDVVMGTIYIYLVLEGARRTIGWPIVIIAIFFLANAKFANYMHFGFFYGPPMAWPSIISFLCMEEVGILGTPVMVIASVVTLFIIFASLLQKSGIVNILLKLAYGLTGAQVGGPAKAAVVSSALMGTISGSSIANVATTGSVTIPLMKKLGYKSYFAGAVEACASTGGQIMPPVMGATAFIIAEFLGVSYLKICIYAVIPAILYFLSVFLTIHYESMAKGLAAIPKSKLPSLTKTLKKGGHLLFFVVVLMYFLIKGYSIQTAIVWTIITTFFLTFIKKETRLTPQSFLDALQEGAKGAISVGMACACAGIIVGSISISGLSWRVSNFLLTLSGENFWLTLSLSMIICIILGMGMTTSAVYLVAATIIVPNLVKMGVIRPAAHLFALYFGVISCITPPVAVASFAAASIARSDINRTGIEAWKIGIPGYIIPFLFVKYPELLLIREGSWFKTLIVCAIVFIGVICFTAGVKGWFIRKLNFYERILAISLLVLILVKNIREAGVMFIFLIIFALIIFLQKIFHYNRKLDSYFFRFLEPLYKKSKSYKQISDIQHKNNNIKQLENIDLEGINISEKKNKNWQGWLVWGCLFAIISIMGKEYFAFRHYNFFLLVLLFLSLLTIIILEFLNKNEKLQGGKFK